MADAKTSLARDGTMQVTAKEGIEYLKAEGKEKLLEAQGLAEPDGAKEKEHSEDTEADDKTKSQQRKPEDSKNESSAEPAAKKPKLAKDSTMAVTAKEGKELLGKEKLGDTRQETSKRNASKPTPKRGVTIAKTVEEAKFVLQGKEIDVNEGRRTRSQSRPATATPVKTPVKRAGTMQKTAKEGKEYVNRSKGKTAKGKGKAVLDDAGDDNVPEEKDGEEEAEDSKEEETAVE